MSSWIGNMGSITEFGSSSKSQNLNDDEPNMQEGGQSHMLEMSQNVVANSDLARVGDDDDDVDVDVDVDSVMILENDDSDGGSGDDDQVQNITKKKGYCRHAMHQIQELETFFKHCPYPEEKHRKELSRLTGLEPLQIKFWFQNKRAQTKARYDHGENSNLREINDKLRADNMQYTAALRNPSCRICGSRTAIGEMSYNEHQLMLQNARLKGEIDRFAAIAAKYIPDNSRQIELGVCTSLGRPDTEEGMGTDLMRPLSPPTYCEADKPKLIELAVAAMKELIKMAQFNEPLWITSNDGSSTILNNDAYLNFFFPVMAIRQMDFRYEATRESVVVMMNHMKLVQLLMDVKQWSIVFAGLVSRSMTMEVLSTGVVGHYDGALQVMTAEFHAPTPLVDTRECYFLRFCKQLPDGIWVIVDTSLDSIRPIPVPTCKRRASGCLIREMPNGDSQVVWVEHVEVEDNPVHALYKNLVNSGFAFGANRWVATLERQCERLASVMSTNIPTSDVNVITDRDGQRSLLKLAERMVISFHSGVSASTAYTWTTISGTIADEVRIMTRKSVNDPGRPPGVILNVAASVWLPVESKTIFDFLREETTRSEWDILSNGVVQEMARIANGHNSGNCVSLLRVKSSNSSEGSMLILQETCTDRSCSFLIYAPVDIAAMNGVLNGGDPDYVAILPSGFVVFPQVSLPDEEVNGEGGEGGNVFSGGSVLSVAFQILIKSEPTPKLSVDSVALVNNLISSTIGRIKASLSCENV